MKVKTVRESIRKLQEKFSKTPLNYTVEESLIAELQPMLRKKGKKINVTANYKDFESEDFEENYTEYKAKYLERICKPSRIRKVQTKVNIGNPSKKTRGWKK